MVGTSKKVVGNLKKRSYLLHLQQSCRIGFYYILLKNNSGRGGIIAEFAMGYLNHEERWLYNGIDAEKPLAVLIQHRGQAERSHFSNWEGRGDYREAFRKRTGGT